MEATPVTELVTRLNSTPRLGSERASYRLETAGKTYWIDFPSCFDRRLQSTDVVMFTHHHFLGVSNQYRELWGVEVKIHQLDSAHELCRRFTSTPPSQKTSAPTASRPSTSAATPPASPSNFSGTAC